MRHLMTLAVALLIGGCLGGCSQMQDDQGKLDMAKLEQLALIAEESGAVVEMDVVLRPCTVGLLEAVYIDTGIEVTARFRWQGDGDAPGSG